jgi:hypothetical protein
MSDPPIVITGGSVTIEFDVSAFATSGGTFLNDQKVIKRVEITGSGIENYDQTAKGADITVKVTYGDP